MKFTAPCFVRVEDAAQRKELMAWLTQLGYNIYDWYWGGCIRVIRCWTSPKGISKAVGYPCKQVRKTDIDCGENIELFKALAAMNDGNDYNQLFIDERDGSMNLSEHKSIGLNALVYRKATVAEIVEHFKNKRK